MTVASKERQVASSEWEGAHLLFASTLVQANARRVAGGINAIATCSRSPNMVFTRHVAGGRVAKASLVPLAIKQRQSANLGWVGTQHLVASDVYMGACSRCR